MPRLIFKCPHIKGGTSSSASHLGNYVKYMATRDGAERVQWEQDQQPATEQQKKLVAQIVRDFPLSCGMFEYEDYQTFVNGQFQVSVPPFSNSEKKFLAFRRSLC